MLMSITWAPLSTCWRATTSASSNLPFRTILANLRPVSRTTRKPVRIEAGRARRRSTAGRGTHARDPATLQRSPMFTKLVSLSTRNGSSPESSSWSRPMVTAGLRGGMLRVRSTMARMWAGVEPQQPPMMLTKLSEQNSTCATSQKVGQGRPTRVTPQRLPAHQVVRHRVRSLVVLAKRVWQAGVRVADDVRWR